MTSESRFTELPLDVGTSACFAATGLVLAAMATGVARLNAAWPLALLIAALLLLARAAERRRRATQSAHEDDRRLARTLESIGDGVIATDCEGRITFLNPVAEALTGWSDAASRGELLEQVYRVVSADSRSAAGGASGARQSLLLARDGREIPIDDGAALIRDANGERLGAVLVFRDVSARRAAAAAQQQRARVEAASAAAEEANRAKDAFLAVLSHELRAPLGAIKGWLALLQKSPSDPQIVARAIQVFERNLDLQTQLIDELLDVSRIVSGKLALAFELREIEPVVRTAVDSLRPAAEAKQLDLIFEDRAAPLVARMDAQRIQQVVSNLVTNAVKFTPSGGFVRLVLERRGDSAHLVVSDSGQGIEPEFLPHVFERFRQQDSSRTRHHEGLGLGLAVVKHLVERHGGTVQAESLGAGRGATFTITLPLAEGRAAGDRPRVVHSNDGATLAEIRILLVEDDPDTRDALRLVLESSGAMVTAVGSARAAMAAFEREKPTLIVSDISMPEQDGYALMRWVRARDGSTPSIAMTGLASDWDRQQARLAGFDEHLSKPVNVEKLVALLRTLAARPASADAEPGTAAPRA